MNKYLIDNMHFDIPDNKYEIQKCFKELLDEKNKYRISFVNPEIFMTSKYNEILKNYLLSTKYNFIDGNGLLMLINKQMKTKYSFNDRYTGTEFFEYLPKDKKINVFLYGSSKENNNLACEKIVEKFPNISITGNIDGYTDLSSDKIVEKINKTSSEIVIVCLGCPKQEIWIKENINKINTKIIFGNGGSIDFWSGNKKRAPEFFIKHRLEWLFRLFQDFSFKRIMRQLKLITFTWNMITSRYKVSSDNKNDK